jgi:hypothetical protein
MLRAFAVIAALSLATVAQGDDEEMTTFEINGLTLSGAEYWPFHGTTAINYPADILWGFYPQAGVIPPGEEEPNPATATPAAVACATEAWRKLKAFVEAEQPLFREVLALGVDHLITPKFYLWTNDYTTAADPYPHGVRESRLWYWTRNPQIPGRTPGYWKWESTVTQDGVCHIPQDDQIRAYLEAKRDELRAL